MGVTVAELLGLQVAVTQAGPAANAGRSAVGNKKTKGAPLVMDKETVGLRSPRARGVGLAVRGMHRFSRLS